MTPIQIRLRRFRDGRVLLRRATAVYRRRLEAAGALGTPWVWATVPAIAVLADATYSYSAVDSFVERMRPDSPSWPVSVPVSLLLSAALVATSWLAEIARRTEESRRWRIALAAAAALPLLLLGGLFLYYIAAMAENGASWLDADSLLKFSVPAAVAATAHLLLYLKGAECEAALQIVALERAESRMLGAGIALGHAAQDLIGFVDAETQNVHDKNLRLQQVGELPVAGPVYTAVVTQTLESARAITQIDPGNPLGIAAVLGDRPELQHATPHQDQTLTLAG